MIKRIALGVTGLFFVGVLGLELSAATAYANKVDCGKVMAEVSAGKKTKEIAKDLSISTSSVYRCKKKASGGTSTAKAGSKASPAASSAASPAAVTSPASH
jgi:hypothetical protein